MFVRKTGLIIVRTDINPKAKKTSMKPLVLVIED